MHSILEIQRILSTLRCRLLDSPERIELVIKYKERFCQSMHNYVHLKEKELIRLTEFITYNVQLIDLIDEDHQKVRQIVRCLLSGI